PFRPQPVHIGVQQEEQRIFYRGRNLGDRASETGMRTAVGIILQSPEYLVQSVLAAEQQCSSFGDYAGVLRLGIEAGRPDNTRNAVRHPELKWVDGAELKGSDPIGNPHEVRAEQAGRGLVEAPVGQGDARVDRLELSFQVQQEGTVPRQETGIEMSLGTSG